MRPPDLRFTIATHLFLKTPNCQNFDTAIFMRILVGWDEGDEVDLLQMYLGIEGNDAVIETDPDTFVSRADKESWDVVLIATSWPDVESSYEIFRSCNSPCMNGQ